MSEAFAFSSAPLTATELPRLTLIYDAPVVEIPAVETPVEQTTEPAEPIVRAATLEDVDSLVQVELSAYANVYGEKPGAATVAAVAQKYYERVSLLGEYVRVLETPEAGVYGMIVCCPTNLTGKELAARKLDMTDNDTISDIYDPAGENGYIVNLAIRPDKQGAGESAKLFANAIQLGVETGVKRTYFESRLPGLKKWISKQLGPEDTWDLDRVHGLADEYWRTTRTLRNGTTKPIDPLLRAYVGIGAKPLELVRDAWTEDTPSQGYGVLCEYTMPEAPDEEPAEIPAPGPEATQDLVAVHAVGETVPELLPNEEIAANPGFVRGIGRWIKRHKTGVLLGSALAGTAISVATGGGGEIVDDVKENAPWVVSAYTASMVGYFASAATMLAKAGQSSLRRIFGFNKNDLVGVSDDLRNSPTMKTAFWVNGGSALSAAGVATAGIVETLPPTAWGALAIPAVDIYSTIALRKWLYGKVIRKK